MGDTLEDVVISPETWTDLYAATGIVVGTPLNVWNKGPHNLQIAVKATSPTTDLGIPLYAGPHASYIFITDGESGAWAYGEFGGRLSVQEA